MTSRRILHARNLLTLILFLILSPLESTAQVCEYFSDGDFSANPTWVGDTGDFRVNGNLQLQLYADGAGVSQLSFPYSMPATDTVEWQFWIKLSFTPTSNNYARVYLYADNGDIDSALHYLQIAVSDPSSSSKEITLSQDGTNIYTYHYRPISSTNALRFMVRMIDRDRVDLFIDSIGSTAGANYGFCGTASIDGTTIPDAAHFGIRCTYTSSRSHSIYLDDIGINSSHCSGSDNEGKTLQIGDLLVSEVLFNPEAGGSDYVELYNNSDSAIELSRIRLATVSDSIITHLYPITGQGTIEPHGLFVVTTDAAYVSSRYTVAHPERLYQMSAMPQYADKSGTVVVATADSVILDRFDYSAKMHSRLLRDKEGVALERRSYERATEEASNWYSASSVSGYGTPTSKNSQSREVLFLEEEFTFGQTLFSPDGDGYNDILDINYTLEQCDLAASIGIYDRHGRLVRTLARTILLGCSGVLTWDGADDNGQLCPRGNYVVVIEAYNEKGAKQSWRHTVSLVTK